MNTKRNVVGWFEIYVQDMERAKAFYQNTFQVTLQRLESPVSNCGHSQCNPTMPDVPGRSSKWMARIRALEELSFTSLASTVQWNRYAQVRMVGKSRKKMSIGQYGFIAFVLDTEGNVIGLHSIQ